MPGIEPGHERRRSLWDRLALLRRADKLIDELVTGGFTLGGSSYDGLEAGDRVLITAEGILVNGAKRWELPASPGSR